MVGFVLNPPRRRHRRHKAHRSHRRGRRRNARGWFHKKTSGSRVAYSHPGRKHNPHRRRRHRKHRRHNPGGSLYALNPHRRRKHSHRRRHHRRRRHNPGGSLYALNPRRRHHRHHRRHHSRRRRNPGGGLGGGLIASVPQVIGFRVPVGGFLGKIANGIVQGTAAGGVVFGGFVLSGYVVNAIDKKMVKADGTPTLGKFQRPVLFGAIAGVMGGVMRFGAKFVKGNPLLWTILGAAGPGLAAVASLIDSTMDKQKSADSGGIVYRLNKIATGLADFIQVGDDAIEAGVGDPGSAVEAGVGEAADFIQVGEPDYNVAEDVG